MGNIKAWAGPLTQNWHNQQVALQHQILQGMRSIGIIPILPAFAGHVPKAISRYFVPKNDTGVKENKGHINITMNLVTGMGGFSTSLLFLCYLSEKIDKILKSRNRPNFTTMM